jgi:hypothetical protein
MEEPVLCTKTGTPFSGLFLSGSRTFATPSSSTRLFELCSLTPRSCPASLLLHVLCGPWTHAHFVPPPMPLSLLLSLYMSCAHQELCEFWTHTTEWLCASEAPCHKTARQPSEQVTCFSAPFLPNASSLAPFLSPTRSLSTYSRPFLPPLAVAQSTPRARTASNPFHHSTG